MSYAIGTTAAGILSLDSLGVPWPRAEVVDYAEYIENGDGDLVGQGWLECRWRFDQITAAQAAVLETYTGACYIRTLRQDGTYAIYSAKLRSAPRRPPKVGQLMDYVAEFVKLVAA